MGTGELVTREPNKIYQNGQIVGDVSVPVEHKDARVRFAQLSNTSSFDRTQPFDYRRLSLRVLTIGTTAGVWIEIVDERYRTLTAVLRDVVCEIDP